MLWPKSAVPGYRIMLKKEAWQTPFDRSLCSNPSLTHFSYTMGRGKKEQISEWQKKWTSRRDVATQTSTNNAT